MSPLRWMYVANIVVAGWISIVCLFFPKHAYAQIFSQAFAYSEAYRLVGALWAAIAVLSVLGLFFPERMSPVLLIQLIYKGLWLLIAALPALSQGKDFPQGMAVFFLVWVAVLPFVIPWKFLLAR